MLILFLVAMTIPNFSSSSFAAVFMQIPGIEGESKDTEHEGWIDLLSIQYLTESESEQSSYKDAGSIEQIFVTKNLDKSSPKITHAVSSGLVIKEVRIDLCDSKSCYEKIVLGNVYLTEYSLSASSGPGNQIAEAINLSFESSQLFEEEKTPIDSAKTTTTADKPIDESLILPEEMVKEIPETVRKVAKWWSQNTVSDMEFANNVEFMIRNNLIQVPGYDDVEKKMQGVDENIRIPEWIRDLIGFWADDKISDQESLNAIEYLVNQKIIDLKGEKRSDELGQ
jgi:type VI secretion system secreted protein Hcp